MELDTITTSESVSRRTRAISEGAPLNIDPNAPRTLIEALERTAADVPGKGIYFVRRDGSEAFTSYPALLEQASRVLAGLRQRRCAPGTKVILQLDRLEDHYTAFWGCMLAGLVPVTVAIAPTYRQRNGVVDKLYNTWTLLDEPPVITTARLGAELEALRTVCGMNGLDIWRVEQLISNPPSSDIHPAQPSDVAFIQLSSGSTGIPKCIQETHQAVIAHIHSSAIFNGYSRSDITLNWLPVDHVVPLLTFHLKDVYLGCEQVHVPTELVLGEPLLWLDLLERYRATHTWAPNFGFKLVADSLSRDIDRHWDLSRVKYFMNAGEQVTMPVVRQFLREAAPFGVRESAMQPAFGMAEVCTCMTYANDFSLETGSRVFLKSSLDGVLEPSVAEDGAASVEFVSLGKVTPGVSIRIVDAQNKLVNERVIGRLQIKGPVVTPGYFRNEGANRDAFVGDGWFNSGDLGFLDRGELFLTGREKEMIIVRGVKYYCYEVEDVVNTVLGVEATCVATCGINDPVTGTEKLAIFFAPAGITDDGAVASAIRRRVTARLGICPGYVVALSRDRFPKTTSGKIQRTRLKEALEAGELVSSLGETDTVAEQVQPQVAPDEIERRVVRIWHDVLGVDAPARTAHLFELGCDSLKATQIVSRVRDEWKAEMPLSSLFDGGGTVSGMAAWIAEHAGAAKPDLPPPIAPAPRARIPLSYSQLRLWLAEQIDPGTSLYHICRTVTLLGPLQFSALELALQAIVRRHEILRTVYRPEDIPVQEVLPATDVPLLRCDLSQIPDGARQHTADNLVALEVSRPFDLATGPLMRVRLLRLGPEEHLLVIVFHQIVTDAWSLKLFFHELRELYRAFVSDAPNPLPSPEVQYADYAIWQQRWLSPAALESQLHYWRGRFSTPPPRLALSSAERATANAKRETFEMLDSDAQPTHSGCIRGIILDSALLREIRSLCATENATLHIVLLAAYQVLLAAVSNQEEVTVGMPESGRHRVEVEKLLGCFTNMLLLRTRLAPGESFRSVLRKVRRNVLEACTHAEVPFEHVMQVIPENGFRDRPFQAWFGPIDSLESFEMGEVKACVRAVFPPDAQFDLSCFFAERPDSALCFFECKQSVLEPGELDGLVESYQRLLTRCVSDPNGAVVPALERQ